MSGLDAAAQNYPETVMFLLTNEKIVW